MEYGGNDLLYLFIAIVTFCGISLIPLRTQSRRSIYLVVIAVVLYIIYELLIATKYPHLNIRVDLLLIWPLLIAAFVKAWYVERRSKGTKVSGFALVSLATGFVGILLAPFLVVSLAAVIYGHRALRVLRSEHNLKGRGAAVTGLVAGYLGLALGIAFIGFVVISALQP